MGTSASISNRIPHDDVILFDGVCNLCNGAVRFIIQRDAKQRFKFSSLQSSFGLAMLKKKEINPSVQSIILIRDQKYYERSDAILEITRYLSGLWPLFYVFKVIPKFIRDGAYDLVARSRYKIFGRTEFCLILTAELKERFVQESLLN